MPSRPLPAWSGPAFISITSAKKRVGSVGRTCSTAPRLARRSRFCSQGSSASAPSGCANTSCWKLPTIFRLPAGRTMAAVISAGLLGTTGEAGLLHFRGAFHNPLMTLPVTLPPVGALLMASAAAGPPGRDLWFTRWWLRLLTAMGFAGAALHAYGVSRNMGGWRNWSQNILNGPPIPAPPSFAGLALAGLAALGLMDDHPDA